MRRIVILLLAEVGYRQVGQQIHKTALRLRHQRGAVGEE